MNRKPRVGLLPLYLALYDEVLPQARAQFAPLLEAVRRSLRDEGCDVAEAPISCVAAEIGAAVERFEREDADLIVTLHLAYSPSLEAADALARSHLPVLMFDTTLDEEFSPRTDPARLMYNHGVHGVQDLASVLIRRGRRPWIAAGHYRDAALLRRTGDFARAALAARLFRSTRALRIGPSFAGMGDFQVSEALLAALGIKVDTMTAQGLAPLARAVADAQINAEVAADRQRFDLALDELVLRRSERVGLALRACLEAGGYSAFSMNFQGFDTDQEPISVVPFLEASRAMDRGIGYAGEGDVLTAALVGALAVAFGKTTFTEIFCPDWKNDTLFLSHMGEVNPALLAGRGCIREKPYPFSKAKNPAFITGAIAPGPAVLVNLAPGPGDTFTLILVSVEMLAEPADSRFTEWVRGWCRPPIPVALFLERYSQAGGTHHSALVIGGSVEALAGFADACGWKVCVINEERRGAK